MDTAVIHSHYVLHRGHCSSIDGVLAYINVPQSYLGFQIKKDVRTQQVLLSMFKPNPGKFGAVGRAFVPRFPR